MRSGSWWCEWVSGVVLGTSFLGALLPLAGEARADSLFGLSYFGGPSRLADGRIEGRGGMGLAYRDSLNAAILTPTQLPDLTRVTFTIAGQFDTRAAEDGYGQVSRTNLQVPTLKIGLPISSIGGFGTGFEASRATQWTVIRPNPERPDLEEIIEREGTQFSIPFEMGVRLNRRLVVGGGFLLERGTVRMRYAAFLGNGLVDPRETSEETHQALPLRLAAAIQDVGPLSVAGYYVPDHVADVETQRRGVALDAREDGKRRDRRPGRWAVGARLGLWSRWSLGADLEQEPWSLYRGRSFLDENGEPVGLKDETTIRLGIEREEIPRPAGRRIPWRIGAYWRDWNYTLGGNDLIEWGVTLGTGIPFRSGSARADIVVGYGRIGTLEENGASEEVLRLVITVSASEKWY